MPEFLVLNGTIYWGRVSSSKPKLLLSLLLLMGTVWKCLIFAALMNFSSLLVFLPYQRKKAAAIFAPVTDNSILANPLKSGDAKLLV
jgi:hypothetical protein